ncbi:MAG: type VI secretion system ATPase TssH [Planctomycetaceae bacterium]|nr:type VI secretion system ATPase TssH [Planctomycetaceae bacterium]
MVQVNLKELIGKLDDVCRRTLEGAAGLCLSRTNYNVEIEHWLVKLLETPNTDATAILRHNEIDSSRVIGDLTKVIDKFKTGNSRPPALSPNLVDLVRAAWLLCSIDYGEAAVRSGHLICALLNDDSLARIAAGASSEFDRISPEGLSRELRDVTANSDEGSVALAAGSATSADAPGKPKGPTKTPSLDQFTIDLTARAQGGHIDPVLGRDHEIRQIIDILTRRRQNNPILTGEAGVGKTAVVEGFALRVAAGDVPPSIQNVKIHTLDLGLLQAGAGVKGEFENRLKGVIDEVKASPTPIIMFIDEAHTMIGAGGAAGQGDAANLLKPALARGELRTVAATTWAEYKKYFEKDAALARRFQVVKVEEPDETAAIEMMRGLSSTLEEHHKVRILNEAVVDAVKLSSRYISGRQLPDKAVSLLDTACARIGLSQSATPPAIEDCRRRIEQLGVSLDILSREQRAGTDHAEQLEELEEQKSQAEAELVALDERLEKELELVGKIQELHAKLEARPIEAAKPEASEGDPTPVPDAESDTDAGAAENPAPPEPLSDEERAKLREELRTLESQLIEGQGEEPLVHPCVNAPAVAETVAAWTGIPVGRMVADEINTVLNLKDLMEESVVGQTHGLDLIAQSIRTSRANLADPRTPIGVFLLAGTSGVGKTETAITLAELLYGGEQNMTTLNMSEFKEEHKVSLLMGSPPGYVGYGEGGVLTEAVRRKPYSVVLLDEMEKAHPGVQDIFYQVFDKGRMQDGEGRDIDFKNTVIIMTTNAGTDLIKSLCADPDTAPDPDGFLKAVFPELLKTFKPAFLGRTTVIPYYPLSDDVMRSITKLKLGKVGRRVEDHYKAKFSYMDELVETIVGRCTEVDTGARNVDHILRKTLLPEMSAEFLARMAEGGVISAVEIGVNEDGSFRYGIT